MGIDPGTASTGYGVIKTREKRNKKLEFKCLDYGLIKTDPAFSAPERLKKLNNELDMLIRKHSPEILVMESLFFSKILKQRYLSVRREE